MHAKRAFGACKLFDPLYLATDPCIEALHSLAHDLQYFGFPEFDDGFIRESVLKTEIPEAICHAKMEFNWETVEGSKQYQEHVLKHAQRARQRAVAVQVAEKAADNEDGAEITRQAIDMAGQAPAVVANFQTFDLWKDDLGEQAQRIWEWWRTWFTSKQQVFLKFARALRLVVLVQTSSAATELQFVW